jgi:hypothetical protein
MKMMNRKIFVWMRSWHILRKYPYTLKEELAKLQKKNSK